MRTLSGVSKVHVALVYKTTSEMIKDTSLIRTLPQYMVELIITVLYLKCFFFIILHVYTYMHTISLINLMHLQT